MLLLRRRHPGAFEELFRRYKDRVWRFLIRMVGRPQVAEDLFQETWLAAARNAHRLRRETQLVAWLLTIARNKHRNGLRFLMTEQRKHAELLVATGEPPVPSAAPEEAADARREAARVAAAFARLPLPYREVLLLALVEGLETREIARVLSLREEAVRKRISRARAELARASGLREGEKDPS